MTQLNRINNSVNMQVSATYLDGFRAISVSPILGPRGVDKCQKLAAAILNRYGMTGMVCMQISTASIHHFDIELEISSNRRA